MKSFFLFWEEPKGSSIPSKSQVCGFRENLKSM